MIDNMLALVNVVSWRQTHDQKAHPLYQWWPRTITQYTAFQVFCTQGTGTNHLHVYRSLQLQWTWSRVNPAVVAEFWDPQGYRSSYYAREYTHVATMANSLRCCNSTGQGNSHELDFGWIPDVIAVSGKLVRTTYNAHLYGRDRLMTMTLLTYKQKEFEWT